MFILHLIACLCFDFRASRTEGALYKYKSLVICQQPTSLSPHTAKLYVILSICRILNQCPKRRKISFYLCGYTCTHRIKYIFTNYSSFCCRPSFWNMKKTLNDRNFGKEAKSIIVVDIYLFKLIYALPFILLEKDRLQMLF